MQEMMALYPNLHSLFQQYLIQAIHFDRMKQNDPHFEDNAEKLVREYTRGASPAIRQLCMRILDDPDFLPWGLTVDKLAHITSWKGVYSKHMNLTTLIKEYGWPFISIRQIGFEPNEETDKVVFHAAPKILGIDVKELCQVKRSDLN